MRQFAPNRSVMRFGSFESYDHRTEGSVYPTPHSSHYPVCLHKEATLMRTQDLDYRDETVTLRGFLAYDETASGSRPGVLVLHEGLGLNEHAMERARMLAELGYVAMAADMFGDRRQASDLEEARALIAELRDEHARLRASGRAALATIASLPEGDVQQVGGTGLRVGG